MNQPKAIEGNRAGTAIGEGVEDRMKAVINYKDTHKTAHKLSNGVSNAGRAIGEGIDRGMRTSCNLQIMKIPVVIDHMDTDESAKKLSKGISNAGTAIGEEVAAEDTGEEPQTEGGDSNNSPLDQDTLVRELAEQLRQELGLIQHPRQPQPKDAGDNSTPVHPIPATGGREGPCTRIVSSSQTNCG